jgi:hypothetical protein
MEHQPVTAFFLNRMEHQHPLRGCQLQAPDVYVPPEPFLLNTDFREYRLKGATNVEKKGWVLKNDHLVNSWVIIITLWLFNIAMENDPFIDGLPITNGDFPWLC